MGVSAVDGGGGGYGAYNGDDNNHHNDSREGNILDELTSDEEDELPTA